MNKPEALIFDLDGTLIDTLEDLADATNAALSSLGLATLPVERYRYLVGAGARKLITRCLSEVAPPLLEDNNQVDQLVSLFKEQYQQNWHQKSKPYPGMEQLVRRLALSGCKMAVLSNKPDPFTQEVIHYFFPDKPFMAVQGQLAGLPLKPDPAGAWHLCRILDADPERTAMIGDLGSDMETAIRAGMLPLAVLWGFRPEDELRDAGAAELFASPEQLEAWLFAGDGASRTT
ncbi:MAG: HAD hydrolase-like protein [Ruminococcaceae bacterium]|jgi:phosphoglycolate phosphatase|nr:HAD hydrolase-like protein [Oscillospiraceae bacterium]